MPLTDENTADTSETTRHKGLQAGERGCSLLLCESGTFILSAFTACICHGELYVRVEILLQFVWVSRIPRIVELTVGFELEARRKEVAWTEAKLHCTRHITVVLLVSISCMTLGDADAIWTLTCYIQPSNFKVLSQAALSSHGNTVAP